MYLILREESLRNLLLFLAGATTDSPQTERGNWGIYMENTVKRGGKLSQNVTVVREVGKKVEAPTPRESLVSEVQSGG